jgi:hypothetical protein
VAVAEAAAVILRSSDMPMPWAPDIDMPPELPEDAAGAPTEDAAAPNMGPNTSGAPGPPPEPAPQDAYSTAQVYSDLKQGIHTNRPISQSISQSACVQSQAP